MGERIGRLVKAVGLASGAAGVPAIAAREALGWLLWPAVAADCRSAPEIETALRAWANGAVPSVEAVCLLPPTKVDAKLRPLKVEGVSVSVMALDLGLFNRLVLSAQA